MEFGTVDLQFANAPSLQAGLDVPWRQFDRIEHIRRHRQGPVRTVQRDVQAIAADPRKDLAQGRRRLAFIGEATSHYPEFRDRYHGFCDIQLEAGIEPDPRLQTGALSIEESGFEAARRLLAGRVPFDAIFAASDLIAMGALRALQEAGKSVPGDISVVGFDDIPAASLTNPPLTTVAQDYNAAGEMLVDTLIGEIGNHSSEMRLLPPRLIVRRTS